MQNLSLVLEHEPAAYTNPTRAFVENVPAERARSVSAYIEAYRTHGYLHAATNPLAGLSPAQPTVPELDPRTYGFERDQPSTHAVDLAGQSGIVTFADLHTQLGAAYCGTLALSSTHVRDKVQKRWLWVRMEERVLSALPAAEDCIRLLSELAAAEALEQFLGTHHGEHKRFGLEGSESLVPLVNALIDAAARQGVEDVVMGMAHRGRLNVLANVLDMPGEQFLSLFSATPHPSLEAWDLREHVGYTTRKTTSHAPVNVFLAHNPSHLESIVPIVCGMARAMQERKTRGAEKRALPLLVHGDAAFCGQGIVSETLNLSQTRGYHVGGTVHIIMNNQIGSTVSFAPDARSTPFCGDLARSVDAPILQVNADDPEAVVAAAHIALDFRMRFAADIVIDLVGYRRNGHSSTEVAALTQPAMQRRIVAHRSTASLYADKLDRRGIGRHGQLERMQAASIARLTAVPVMALAAPALPAPARAAAAPSPGAATAVPEARLRGLLGTLATMPDGFAPHPMVAQVAGAWRGVADGRSTTVDWRLAENLAYATLLDNSYNVRISGLDVGRGSFYHRLAVWHNQTGAVDGTSTHVPLRQIARGNAYFSVFDSPLSEEAVLGFEYGYALQCQRDLVIWEAQLGDFVNNAQVIIDQYVATGEAKWGYANGLVILLPHGNEGAGPEHSSGFVGRFLQLCADGNLRVAMPSTPAQLFHMLRRQALSNERKPLVVMTPKVSMLRHEPSYSRLDELGSGEFRTLIGDMTVDPSRVSRVIVTSGKLYYDLTAERTRTAASDTAIVRAEQLYPFPVEALGRELARYPRLTEVVWAQEEAKNHGAWHFVRDDLQSVLRRKSTLRYAGRPPAGPSAVCNPVIHAAEQRAVVASAFGADAAAA